MSKRGSLMRMASLIDVTTPETETVKDHSEYEVTHYRDRDDCLMHKKPKNTCAEHIYLLKLCHQRRFLP